MSLILHVLIFMLVLIDRQRKPDDSAKTLEAALAARSPDRDNITTISIAVLQSVEVPPTSLRLDRAVLQQILVEYGLTPRQAQKAAKRLSVEIESRR